MLKWIILFVVVTTALAEYRSNTNSYDNNNNYYDNQIHWWDTDDNKVDLPGPGKTVPFPDCLRSGSKSKYLQSSALKKAFDAALQDEKRYTKKQTYVNYQKNYHDKMDDYDYKDGNYNDKSSGRDSDMAAAAAMKLTRSILTKLACDLNGTDPSSIEELLKTIGLEDKLCPSRAKVDCTLKSRYRMPSGLCNNLERPYEGNSHTVFGRITNADYADRVGKARRDSVRGGSLPNCRQVSLELGSKPIFNRVFNNFFTIFGQYIAHDIALSVPVTDSYSTPISTCTCESRSSKDKCTVIDIPSNDPTMGGQKCMAFPETAQAFRDDACTLGVKEQLNGQTAFIDLSGLYGASTNMAEALRSTDGQLKSTRRYGSRVLPPSQREGKSCGDGTEKYPCLAGGDSRLSISLLFTGIQTTFLRANNDLAAALKKFLITLSDNEIYEQTRSIVTGYFQKVTYADWLPILLGHSYTDDFNILTRFLPTPYSESVKPIVFNEVSSAAFRLHTLCRDLFSRCTPDGTRIDQLWLDDILHKVKYAYDIQNYGLDSIMCGAMYDYGFAFDGNFAYQIHYRLFESNNGYGQLWRNDLIAINICRAREHGIPSYTKLLEVCLEKKVKDFNDLGSTINYQGIKQMKKLYKHVDDIDAFVGLNLEDPSPGALVGPTTACLLKTQFDNLKYGDRFFYSNGKGSVSEVCAAVLRLFPYQCFLCSTVDIETVPENPFRPPGSKNRLANCNECGISFTDYVLVGCFGVTSDPAKSLLFLEALLKFYERQLIELLPPIGSGLNVPPQSQPAVPLDSLPSELQALLSEAQKAREASAPVSPDSIQRKMKALLSGAQPAASSNAQPAQPAASPDAQPAQPAATPAAQPAQPAAAPAAQPAQPAAQPAASTS